MSRYSRVHLGMERSPGMNGRRASRTVRMIMMLNTWRSPLDDEFIGGTWYQSV